MQKTVVCIIARTSSTRLPKKVLKEIYGIKLIEYIIEKTKKSKNLDELYLCTSIDPDDEILLEIAEKHGIKSYAGSRESVIDRMIKVGDIENATNVVRVTGDNIFSDEVILDAMIELHNEHNADYTISALLPRGISPEIFSLEGIKRLYNSLDPQQSEYLAYYALCVKNDLKKLIVYPPKKYQKPFYTLTVDFQEDLDRSIFILDHLKDKNKIYYDEIIELADKMTIPHLIFPEDYIIKLPDKIEIKYKDYLEQLNKRFQGFINYNLSDDFYEKYKNK